MKRAFCVAVVLLVLAPAAFVTAGFLVNSKSEGVVVTGSTLYGDPDEAAGLKLRVTSQWQDHLVWDTLYNVGSGETESDFSFYSYGKNWQEPVSAGVDLWMSLQWGMARTSGPSRPFDPDGSFLPNVVRAVMDRTKPGESRTETVRLSEYYEYYPLRFSINNSELNLYYDDEEFYADFFHVPVPDWLTLEIFLEKDETGDVIALDCNSEYSISFFGTAAFGQEGCYYAYYLEDQTGIGTAETGADYGIYFIPYVIGPYRNSIAPEQTRELCDLLPGLVPVDMGLNEKLGELYLVTLEEQDYYLNVYQIGQEALTQKQKIFVRSMSGEPGEEGNPFWVQMSVRNEGVLMVWRDGSFALVVPGEEEMELWCLEQHPGNEMVFPYEHEWAFDGQRLALASFEDIESMGVEIAVYNTGELSWYGVCAHSGDVGRDQVSFLNRIKPPGTQGTTGGVMSEYVFSRRRISVEELLELQWE